MKILHTSDWHIGHKLHQQERTEEHLHFFQWLMQVIESERVDLLVISGDIFDVGYPSNAMLQQYYDFILQLKESHCKRIIITGGNHDQISTLNAPKELLRQFKIDVVGGMPNSLDQEIFYIDNGEKEIAIIATPFLRDRDIRQSLPGESFEDKMKATEAGIVAHYRQAVDHVLQEKESSPFILAMGHLLVTGASTSESEREIHIGTLQGIDANLFPEEIDYFALGHIHRPQKIKSHSEVRYSGSPIPLSFSEHRDTKQVVLIDIDKDNKMSVTTKDVPKLRKWGRVKGTLEEVKETLSQHTKETSRKDWFEVQIVEPQYHPDIIVAYEQWLETERENEQYKVIKESLRFESNHSKRKEAQQYARDLSEMSVEEVFDSLLMDHHIEEREPLMQTLKELISNNPTLLD
ncbi:exonuclease SbcCD subunit D C-terminal domain-containing protein [Halosquirtibacter laminarini]|uniref:Exonuclease SbcCD subunit D C-terminal domain-containing protein n=1 Tax=Halosquirtibacter laminarini TaxID=3374600 RepID=A0AC61NHR3_9BACT|nr:exonuclease SbcCD subunit D C-terminal domain-containing protein [Prolixibacteraceae bacterium]